MHILVVHVLSAWLVMCACTFLWCVLTLDLETLQVRARAAQCTRPGCPWAVRHALVFRRPHALSNALCAACHMHQAMSACFPLGDLPVSAVRECMYLRACMLGVC